MATLTPSTVVSARTLVIWVIRLAALYLVLRGGYLALQRLLMALIVGQPEMAWGVWMEIGNESHRVSIGSVMVVIGILLAIFNRPLGAWLTPAPKEGCPACGFSRGDEDPTRCTECGLPGVNKK